MGDGGDGFNVLPCASFCVNFMAVGFIGLIPRLFIITRCIMYNVIRFFARNGIQYRVITTCGAQFDGCCGNTVKTVIISNNGGFNPR